MEFRSEYLKLGSDLPGLARDFDCHMDPRDCHDTLVLALAMDRIDERIDTLPVFADRQAVYREVLHFLATGQGDLSGQSESYQYALREVRQAAMRVGRLHFFVKSVERVMMLGEDLRLVRSPRDYAELCEQEGDATVAMLFEILSAARPSERFRKFLRHSGMVGHMTDKLLDLDEDRRDGITCVGPGAWVYILPRILRAAVQVPFLHPRPFSMLRWSWTYFTFGVRYVSKREPAMRSWSPPPAPAGSGAVTRNPPLLAD